MNDETTEEIPTEEPILKAIAELSRKVDDYKKESDAQFEAIRQGIVHNGVSYDRLKAEVLLLRADVKELSEEVRRNSIKTLV